MSRFFDRTAYVWAFLICLVGGVFTYSVHHPTVGIDDANITQTYASHIALGHGYVYNIQGEHVEGSTSLIWTAVNALFYMYSDAPEPLIAILTFAFTVMTVGEIVGMLQVLGNRLGLSVSAVISFFAAAIWAVPSFFTWSVWSLMDLTMWTWCFSVVFSRLTQAAVSIDRASPAFWWPVWVALLAFPLVRPEGIVLAGVFFGLIALLAFRDHDQKLMKVASIAACLTAVLLVVATTWRIHYFGYPFPNTFYAKVSMSFLLQAKQGLIYFYAFLRSPVNLSLFVFSFVGIVITTGRLVSMVKVRSQLKDFVMSAVFTLPFATVISVYVLVGGDHFGSARQFQVFMPALCALSAVCLAQLWRELSQRGLLLVRVALSSLVMAVVILQAQAYTVTKGKLDIEFRIAESGRALGVLLNEFPRLNAIGIVAAGGISRTYRGALYDLVGLNWVEMAHSPRGLNNVARPKNHAAFNKDVLYTHVPDVILPTIEVCDRSVFVGNDFNQSVMDDIFAEDKFKSLYAFGCFKGVSFFVRRDLIDRWPAGLVLSGE